MVVFYFTSGLNQKFSQRIRLRSHLPAGKPAPGLKLRPAVLYPPVQHCHLVQNWFQCQLLNQTLFHIDRGVSLFVVLDFDVFEVSRQASLLVPKT